MKEEEAKEKQCPIGNAAALIGYEVSKGERANRAEVLCVASDCMMWVSNTTDEAAWEKITTERQAAVQQEKESGGHCGLTNR